MNRVNLAPLADTEIAELVCGLLGAHVSLALLAPILERAEGNPLYAEEFVRLLRDRAHLVQADGMVSRPDPGRAAAARVHRGADRRPPRHAAPGVQGDAVRCRGRGQGVLGGCRCRDGRTRRQRGHRGDARACAQGTRPSCPAEHDGRRGGVRVLDVLTRDVGYAELPRASAVGTPRGGRSMDGEQGRPGGSRTSPKSSPTTTPLRSSSHEPLASRSGRLSSRNPPSATSPWPARRR